MHRLGLVRASPAESAYPNRQNGKHESKKKEKRPPFVTAGAAFIYCTADTCFS